MTDPLIRIDVAAHQVVANVLHVEGEGRRDGEVMALAGGIVHALHLAGHLRELISATQGDPT